MLLPARRLVGRLVSSTAPIRCTGAGSSTSNSGSILSSASTTLGVSGLRFSSHSSYSSLLLGATAPSLRLRSATPAPSLIALSRRWASRDEQVFDDAAEEDEQREGLMQETDADMAGPVAQEEGRPRQRGPPEGEARPSTVYVGNLYFDVTNDALRQHFERFGEIVNVAIAYDSRGLSKGFAFIEFKDDRSAREAIERLNGEIFEGRRMSVQQAVRRQRRQRDRDREATRAPRNRPLSEPSRTLYVGNMSTLMTDRDLNELFRELPGVLDVRVAIDRATGKPRGFAHVDFPDLEAADAGRRALAGKVFYGRTIYTDYTAESAFIKLKSPHLATTVADEADDAGEGTSAGEGPLGGGSEPSVRK